MRTGIFGVIDGDSAVFGCDKPSTEIESHFYHDSDSVAFALHGLWLNPPTYSWKDSSPNSLESLLKTTAAFNEIDGPLQGFYYSKESKELTLHTDFARQHPIFYYHEGKFLAFAPTISQLVKLLKENGIQPSADEEGAAMLLTYACVLGEKTLISGVKKLLPGHSLNFKSGKVSLIDRSNIQSISRDLKNLDDAVDLVSEAFTQSTKQMCDLNAHHGKTQLNLLSGGIDSRMVFLETNAHASDIHTLCFSVKDYVDHKVSLEISSDFGATYHFHDLKDGGYMMNTSSAEQYDGTITYLASSHHRDVIENLNLKNLGVIAGGAIGNGVLSEEFFIPNSNKNSILNNMATNPDFASHCSDAASEAWSLAPESSNFKLQNRGFLYTNSGAYSTQPYGVLHSPFTSRKFVEAAHSLHPDLLKNHTLYMEWMKRKHPAAIKYIWERYGARPVQGLSLKASKLKMKVLAKFIHPLTNFKAASMSPVQHWYNTNSDIASFYSSTFTSKQHLLSKHLPSIADAIISSFPTMSVTNKAATLTLLISLETYLN